MSSESQPLVSPSTPLPSTLPWTLADEEALTKREMLSLIFNFVLLDVINVKLI